jgi:arylsulfatase A-like enzyme
MSDDRGLLCTAEADVRWPPDERVPEGIATDAYGYPANQEVLEHLLPVVADAAYPFVFGHMNESDTAGHEHGPESEAAQACYRKTDSDVGKILEALKPIWNDTIVIVVSDHDMDTETDSPIDIERQNDVRELIDGVIPDGGAALVHLRDRDSMVRATQAIAAMDGVTTVEPMSPDVLIAGARKGRRFTSPAAHPGGFHGGPASARSVSIVGGGHPLASRIAASLERKRPHLADWAPTIAQIFGVSIDSDGGSLLS